LIDSLCKQVIFTPAASLKVARHFAGGYGEYGRLGNGSEGNKLEPTAVGLEKHKGIGK
jgi:hypothetical protein